MTSASHGSVLFPTWHRPYVLLIEVSSYVDHFILPTLTYRSYAKQSIGEQAAAIAQEFDRKEGGGTKWQKAAEELRFP